MKKILSLVLALTMIMMVGAAFAAEAGEFAGGAFSDTPENTLTLTNLDSGDSVVYIQLLEWDPEVEGGWKLTANGTTADVALADLLDGITAAEAATIANNLKNVTGTAMSTNGTTATASNVAPGLYYLRATAQSKDTIYNPMFVSADYYTGGNELSANTKIGSSAVVKKSTVTFDKKVDETDEYKWNDVKPGDVIPYKITSQIPTYGANYDKAVFEITDTFSTGLELDGSISVKYGETTVTASDTNVTITPKADKSGFTVSFAEAYLLKADRPVTNVEITYSGKVTTAAPKNVNPLDNTADLEYSNAPGETNDKHDITRHYTFSIDADALGKDNQITRELMKIGLDSKGNPITSVTNETVHDTVVAPLGGASFTLTPVAPTTGSAKTIESDATGRIVFKGLDAGEYTLVENSAPAGYVKDSRTYTVKIIPTYDTTVKDMLLSYKVEFWLGETKATTATFTCEDNDVKVTETTLEDASQFIGNTQGAELPSTGGIGTTIFYILGGLLVVGAAVILIARRKAQD